jgi:hypothetical protein
MIRVIPQIERIDDWSIPQHRWIDLHAGKNQILGSEFIEFCSCFFYVLMIRESQTFSNCEVARQLLEMVVEIPIDVYLLQRCKPGTVIRRKKLSLLV